MKKLLYTLTIGVIALMSSCSNEDILIDTTSPTRTLTINVNPEPTYAAFDVTGSIINQLRDKKNALSIRTYVYDALGNLKAEEQLLEYALNSMPTSFSLPSGQYTVLTVIYLVDPDTKESYAWTISGTDKLSTIAIEQNSNKIYYSRAIGTTSTSVNLTEDAQINLTPSAIGSMIDTNWLYFNYSDYTKVSFGTFEHLEKYRLDPSLNDDDRFVYEMSASKYFTGRGDTEVTSDNVGFTMYVLDKKINYAFMVQGIDDGTTWYDYSSNRGTVNLSNGVFYYAGAAYQGDKAFNVYFGDYSGYLKWEDNVSKPDSQVELLPNICTDWGATVTNVQNAMKGWTLIEGESGKAVLQDDGSYSISYDGNDYLFAMDYIFKTQTSGLYEVLEAFYNETAPVDALKKALDAKYDFLIEDEGDYYYIGDGGKTAIILMPIGVFNFLFYYDMDYMMSAPAHRVPAKYSTISLDRGNLSSLRPVQLRPEFYEPALSERIAKAIEAIR